MGLQLHIPSISEAEDAKNCREFFGRCIKRVGVSYWQMAEDILTEVSRTLPGHSVTKEECLKRIQQTFGIRDIRHAIWCRLVMDRIAEQFALDNPASKEGYELYREAMGFIHCYGSDHPSFGDDETGGLVIAGFAGEKGKIRFGRIDNEKDLPSVRQANDGPGCNTGLDDLIGGLIALIAEELISEIKYPEEAIEKKVAGARLYLTEELRHYGFTIEDLARTCYDFENPYCEGRIDWGSFYNGTFPRPLRKVEVSDTITAGIELARMVDKGAGSYPFANETFARSFGRNITTMYGPMADTVFGCLIMNRPGVLQHFGDREDFRKQMLLTLLSRIASAVVTVLAHDYFSFSDGKGVLELKTQFN